jgi:hypothetical protein
MFSTHKVCSSLYFFSPAKINVNKILSGCTYNHNYMGGIDRRIPVLSGLGKNELNYPKNS